MKKNNKKSPGIIGLIVALIIAMAIFSPDTESENYTAGNNKDEITSTQTEDNKDGDNTPKDELEEEVETGDDLEEQPEEQVETDSKDDIFDGYTLIEVDGGDLSGHREPNVVVDIGFGNREYYAFTNEYGQLVKVIAKEIILQNDATEPVTSQGRYYRDEAKVPGVESKNLDEGHVIADSLGGVSNAYNITPQNSTLNRHGDQAYMEKVIREAGGCTDFVAIITYPDTTTQIPSHYSYTYTLKGNVINDEFDNINPDEYNATLEDNTTSTGSTAGSNTNANENINNNSSSGTSTGTKVYWTPNGKSYHTTNSCSALSRSKTILEGTLQESGKSDPCDRCH